MSRWLRECLWQISSDGQERNDGDWYKGHAAIVTRSSTSKAQRAWDQVTWTRCHLDAKVTWVTPLRGKYCTQYTARPTQELPGLFCLVRVWFPPTHTHKNTQKSGWGRRDPLRYPAVIIFFFTIHFPTTTCAQKLFLRCLRSFQN